MKRKTKRKSLKGLKRPPMAKMLEAKEHNKLEILRILANVERRTPPSIPELAAALNVEIRTIHRYLDQLEKAGDITQEPQKHRSRYITPQGLEKVQAENERLTV